MRILQILPELNVGGVETGTVDFAKYLVQHGHHSVVVSNGGAMAEEIEKCGSKHYRLPVHKKSVWTALRCIRVLKKIILEEKIDVVHARSRVPAWIAFFACRSTPAEFITTCHGYYSVQFFSRVMAWSKFIIVPSEIIGRHMVESFKVRPDSIRVIPRSVDLTKFKNLPEPEERKSSYVVTIVGRLSPLKGHTFFLRAMAKVIRSMPYVKVWIIGDAPAQKEGYKQELQLLVRRLGLKDHVEFLGSRKDVPQLLAQSDVMVFSSVVPESFGRVILEAQAVGVPVVATKVGGVLDIIDDEKTGLLVLPKDPDRMADAVLRLLQDRKLARDLVQQARKKIKEKFTLNQMAEKTLAVYQELKERPNILVIKMSSIGDVILATASLRALRKHFPQAIISCLVGSEARQVLQRCPYLDELIVIDILHDEKGLGKLIRFSRKLRKCQFDAVIDLQNSRKSHFLAGLSFARETYGFHNGKWSFLLTNKVKMPRQDVSPVRQQFLILERLGIKPDGDDRLEMWTSPADEEYVSRLLESEWLKMRVQIVGIHLAASQKWETKNWPKEYIARLCDLLAARNVRVLLTGSDKDRETAIQVVNMTKTRPANFVGKTDLMQLAALIRKCNVFITPDSAPLHIAAAVQTPVIALFGPTSSARHMPPVKKGLVLEKTLPCAPCYDPSCRVKTHACLRGITPEEMAQRVLELLEPPK